MFFHIFSIFASFNVRSQYSFLNNSARCHPRPAKLMKFGDSGRSVLSVFSLSVRHTECVTQLFPARRPSTHSLSHCCNQYTNGRNLLLKPENKDLSINRFACSERTAESLRRKMLRTFRTLSECGVWKCGHSYVKHDVKLDFGIFRIFQSI